MNIKPLADRVLILPAPAEEKTIGGIIIPDTAKEKPLKGEVVAAGNGTKDEEMILKVGDTVLYGKYAGTELEFEGVNSFILTNQDITNTSLANKTNNIRRNIFICHLFPCRLKHCFIKIVSVENQFQFFQ